MPKTKKLMPPVHPGEILREDFLKPLRLTVNRAALEMRLPATRIFEIVHERRGISAETALRLGHYFNTSARFWLNLQTVYDLEIAESKLGKKISRQVQPLASAV